VFQLFEQLVSQGKTIVMVTHDRDLAQRVTRTVIIADGQIIEEYLARTFPGLSELQLVRVTRQVARQTFAPGETIIQAGAPPANFYMITDGEVEVHLRTPNGEEFIVARRGKGQYIGEIELLRGGNSIATVRAAIDQGAELAALDPQEFATAVAESAAARDAIDQVAGERLAETLPGLGRASP
jgi:CRP-like cAMP-binding protein